jgi:hypothetical protein
MNRAWPDAEDAAAVDRVELRIGQLDTFRVRLVIAGLPVLSLQGQPA